MVQGRSPLEDPIHYDLDGISPARRAFDRWFIHAVLGVTTRGLTHWLGIGNTVNGVIFFGALAVPLMVAAGWSDLARTLFWAYSALCAQIPERSYFVFGYQAAMDHRMIAIYGAGFLAGLAYAPIRDSLPALSWRGLFLVSLPMALDGFSQLLGWRESNWELRTITGVMFGGGLISFAYPRIEREVRCLLAPRHRPGSISSDSPTAPADG